MVEREQEVKKFRSEMVVGLGPGTHIEDHQCSLGNLTILGKLDNIALSDAQCLHRGIIIGF